MTKYIKFSNIFKALSHPLRLRIIEIIGTKKYNISKIKKELEISQSNLSQHLKILEDAGIIKKIKKDNNVLCELKYEKIIDIINQVDYIIKKEIDLSMEIMKK
ncbi:ArsR family transcriptional regulator [Marinitoga hydrogenitolerans DSM 16785]|uniref:ArsR family transcriptional regulator n=1 Tax=Marinitoga hydrogenitolerans (strain DSM 16785 / JCM 12826 / AT1271) TaxID=1122195 RepID=A0A1M4YHF6_MARH1|nr:metalloregulator ArsR/SmtB family transcription factor [Marinitoga hydrogenitolerans]SHF05207.1 ArsR family transcriptional regulator [Marinitoga hydrogenitolerans DSM 16785]